MATNQDTEHRGTASKFKKSQPGDMPESSPNESTITGSKAECSSKLNDFNPVDTGANTKEVRSMEIPASTQTHLHVPYKTIQRWNEVSIQLFQILRTS